MTGKFFKDDSIVCFGTLAKKWATGKQPGEVRVEVYEMM